LNESLPIGFECFYAVEFGLYHSGVQGAKDLTLLVLNAAPLRNPDVLFYRRCERDRRSSDGFRTSALRISVVGALGL
jgi:hypothetical protein